LSLAFAGRLAGAVCCRDRPVQCGACEALDGLCGACAAGLARARAYLEALPVTRSAIVATGHGSGLIGRRCTVMDARTYEMYRVTMDQLAQEDIAAAAAAHRELGHDYDGAVAQSLVDRIGDEIDKRVDARLGRSGDHPVRRHRSGELSRPVRASFETVSLALGSMIIGGIISWNVLNAPRGGFGLFVFIWVVIAVINIAYARRR
jgi:hypothetical protein